MLSGGLSGGEKFSSFGDKMARQVTGWDGGSGGLTETGVRVFDSLSKVFRWRETGREGRGDGLFAGGGSLATAHFSTTNAP